jgi:sarcosine oxidase
MTGFDVIIIGAGVMGAAAAVEVARGGASVLLLDQSSIPNPRAASIDHSKVFRFAYPDTLYVSLAVEAERGWLALEEESGTRVMTRTGILLLGREPHSFETQSYEALRELSLEAERLTPWEVASRFPQFNPDAFHYAVFDPSGAILHAETAVRALATAARRRGVSLIENQQVVEIKRGLHHRAEGVVTRSGELFSAERMLIASGPWTRALVPTLADKLVTTRQEVFYFEPQARETLTPAHSFDVGQFPIFTALDLGFYGFPVHHLGAMKIANHNKGEAADPQSVTERVSEQGIEGCRAFFSEFIPALERARFREGRVCIYNNTADDDFLIDWHTEFENVLIATGFSGHGFKFGPTIGRISADLLLEGKTKFDIERFRIVNVKRKQ